MGPLYGKLSRGAKIIKDNPQILYTIFLLVFIPLAFLYSGQKFLGVANSNQERIEKGRIGLFQDVFSDFAAYHFDDSEFIQKRVENVAKQNPSIVSMRILDSRSGDARIMASINKSEIGKLDSESDKIIKTVGIPRETSAILPISANGERHWVAFRVIKSVGGKNLGAIVTDFSMAGIDKAASDNIRRAFAVLLIIVLSIFALLIGHARMLDYVQLYKKIREADKMKDDFISIASHELRAPLTAIKWQADAMVEIEKSKSDGIVKIQQAAGQLEKLVEDMLDVSRIEQGRMKFDIKRVDASEVVKSAVDFLKPTAEEKGLKIICERTDPAPINADPVRLSQVITNLVNNSIKYTEEGEIKIEAKEKENRVNITVHDTGIGISAEDQKKLFQKFNRVKTDETRGIRGTGLGLWITKQIVQKMNGAISVESIKDVGSSFTVSFPIAKN